MSSIDNFNAESFPSFHNNGTNNTYSNTIKPNSYGLDKDTVDIKKETTDKNNKKSKLLKWSSIVGSGIAVATIGIFTAKHISAKNAKKAAEELKKLKLQEAEEAARKAQEEARIAQEKALKAKQEAQKKAMEEAQKKRELEIQKEAARKAEAEAARIAKQKALQADSHFKNTTEDRLKAAIHPEGNITRSIPRGENEKWDSYYARLKKVQAEECAKIDYHEFTKKLEQTPPENIYEIIAEELEICHKNGGTASFDDAFKMFESAKSTMDSSYRAVYEKNRFLAYDLKPTFEKHKQYIDEVVAEINANKSSGENPAAVVRKSMTNVNNRRKAAVEARKQVCETISRRYEEQLAPIRERLVYDEANIPPVNKKVTLNREEKQKFADELNEIIKSGGQDSQLTSDTPLSSLQSAWRNKYISMPFSMQNKTGETAVLDMFPRYESGIIKYNGERYEVAALTEFKYEPLYRQMHIENPEEFVRQFENVGGVYSPGRLQSCSKEKYFGECWGPLGCKSYGFAEWSPNYNVKFVIHPKGPVSNAAEIGEGKYGNLEAIYAADSQFRILGTVKKTVTLEEMQQAIPGFKSKFEDFEKYEIHLQEM